MTIKKYALQSLKKKKKKVTSTPIPKQMRVKGKKEGIGGGKEEGGRNGREGKNGIGKTRATKICLIFKGQKVQHTYLSE